MIRRPRRSSRTNNLFPYTTRFRSVAETGGGQRRHREVERVDVVHDFRIAAVLQREDQGRSDEDEDREIHAGDDDFLVVAEEGGLSPEVAQHMVGVHQPRSEEHTSALQSLMSISYAVLCLKKNNK